MSMKFLFLFIIVVCHLILLSSNIKYERIYAMGLTINESDIQIQ